MVNVPAYQIRAAELVAARDAQIPEALRLDPSQIPHNPSKLYRKVLSPREVDIVESDVTGSADAIAKKQYTSSEVTEAYLKSAAAAHSATNCSAWFDVNAARERAKWSDHEMEKNGVVGPLHGVPMSVKDFMCVKGFPQSSGHSSSAGHVPKEDADMTAIFRAAGVVYFAKTTQPQSIMHLETSNFYGTTTNSHNRDLTSGGSSGGEGALVGCRGSPIGITTDVGGSTRNPAAFNGLWGFKPTCRRVPRDGMLGLTAHSRIMGAIGPVCHSKRDLDSFYRVLFDTPTWQRDIKLVPLGWRDVNSEGQGAGFNGWSGSGNKLRIGVMRDDGVVRPVKPIRRAIEAVVEKLGSAGDVELVEFPAKWFEEGWAITNQSYYVDGAKKLRDASGDEPMRPLTEWITSKVSQNLSREQVDELIARRNEIRQMYYDYFNSLNLDVILSPAGPAPAQPVGTTKWWAYTSMWNMMDWPAAVFPTGSFVDDGDTEVFPEPKNEHEKHLYETYSAEVARGSPVGSQLIAPRWQDERSLAALGEIDRVSPL